MHSLWSCNVRACTAGPTGAGLLTNQQWRKNHDKVPKLLCKGNAEFNKQPSTGLLHQAEIGT